MRPPEELLIHSNAVEGSGTLVDVGVADAGWDFVSLRVEQVANGDVLEFSTGDEEVCLVPLVGAASVEVNGEEHNLVRPGTMFDGRPCALYVPIGTDVKIIAGQHAEIAITGSKATQTFPVKFIPPGDIEVEIRGAGNAARQINHIIKPEFPADKLLVVEVFTPSGNWSSFPPHKHDVEDMPNEAVLEEIYYYRIDRPDGFGLQRLYTADGSFDHGWVIKDGDLLLVPEGYHAFAVAHGYTGYYLNVLAGPADYRTMQPSDDPAYAWVRGSWNDDMNRGLSNWQDIENHINGDAGKRFH